MQRQVQTMLTENLDLLLAVATDPRASMERYLAKGKKVAGCVAEYAPEALIHAAGAVPFGLWGGETAIMQADKYMPNFACSIMRSCVELALGGKYEGLAFVTVPVLCDALKGCSQTLRTAVRDFPTLPFALPQNRALRSAEEFTAQELNALRGRIEALLGTRISDGALDASIAVYNAHNAAMRAFAAAAAEHTDVITPTLRMAVFKSAWFMEKAEHSEIVEAVTGELRKLPPCRRNDVAAVLSGVTAGSMDLMRILEEERIDVVGDWVYQDSWAYAFDIPDGADPIRRLAGHWMRVGGCCFAHEKTRTRPAKLLEIAKETGANAAILCVMKFCDPEEYELPQLLAAVRKELPVLTLDIDQNSDNSEQLRTRIQSFREIF